MFYIFLIFLAFSQDLEKAKNDLDKVTADLKKIEDMIETALKDAPPEQRAKYFQIKEAVEKDPKKFSEFILNKLNKDLLEAKTDEERKSINEEIASLNKLIKTVNFDVKKDQNAKVSTSKIKFLQKPFPEAEDIFDKISISYSLRWQTGILNPDGLK